MVPPYETLHVSRSLPLHASIKLNHGGGEDPVAHCSIWLARASVALPPWLSHRHRPCFASPPTPSSVPGRRKNTNSRTYHSFLLPLTPHPFTSSVDVTTLHQHHMRIHVLKIGSRTPLNRPNVFTRLASSSVCARGWPVFWLRTFAGDSSRTLGPDIRDAVTSAYGIPARLSVVAPGVLPRSCELGGLDCQIARAARTD